MFQFFGLEYGVNGYKAVTRGHFSHFWKKSKGVEWELGETSWEKAGSRPIWPSTVFGSGVLEAAGALDKEWSGMGPEGEAMLRDQLNDSMNLFPPPANKGAGSC